MERAVNKIKGFASIIGVNIFLFALAAVSRVQAVCPDNVVPNPLDPECKAAGGISLGSIINRFIPSVQTLITISFVFLFLFVTVSAGFAKNFEDFVKKISRYGFIIYAILAVNGIFVIGIILENITGFDLLGGIGL